MHAFRELVANSMLWEWTTMNISRPRYEIIMYWSDEDQAIVAEIPELPGCMAHGSDYQDALANAQSAIDAWIATAQELGREIPTPKGRLMYA